MKQDAHFSGQIIDVLEVGYKTDKTPRGEYHDFVDEGCELLEEIATTRPKYTLKAINVFDQSLKLTKVSRPQVKQSLLRIVKARPEAVHAVGMVLGKNRLMTKADQEDLRVLFDIRKYVDNTPVIEGKNVEYYKLRMKNKDAEYADSYIKVSDGFIVEQINEKASPESLILADLKDVEENNPNIIKSVENAPYIVGREFVENMVVGEDFAKSLGVSYSVTVHASPVSAREYAQFKRKAEIQNKSQEFEAKYEIYTVPPVQDVNEDILQAKMVEMKEKLAEHGVKIGDTADKASGKVTAKHKKVAKIQIDISKALMKAKRKKEGKNS